MVDSTSQSSNGPGVFSRKASGLLRVAGAWDTFIFNIGLVSVGIAIALNQYYGPSLYGGAAPWISTILAAIGMLFAAGTFYLWSVTFPRSGGVYLSLSRGVSPGFAFVMTLLETIILMYYAALAASLIVSVGLSSFLGAVGLVSGSEQLIRWSGAVVTPHGMFICGAIILLLAGGLLASGTRNYFLVQRVMFVIALGGTLVIIGVLAFGSEETFLNNLQALTGLEPETAFEVARENGWAPAEFDWGQTVAFLVWPLLPLLGAIQSVGIGGEIKRVDRSQLYGMFGAVIAAAGIIAVVGILSDSTFGYDLQAAMAYNSILGNLEGSIENAAGASPWFTVLAAILTNSVVLTTIIMAAFVAWIWFWIPAEIAYTTRTMVAWSFDRLAPDALGEVSERFHTPVVAIGLSTLISIVFMALIAYANIALLTLVEILLVVWGSSMLAAVFFPKAKPELFKLSPASRVRFVGLPVMSITGLIAAAFFAVVIWMLWHDVNAAGPLVSSSGVTLEFWIVLGAVVLGTIWYLVTRAKRKREGVDLDLAFRQLPIE
jgi:amino acid transporter